MGALRIRCPLCGKDFPVPASVTEVHPETHLVSVVLDRTELYGHLQDCAKAAGAPPPSPTKVVVLRGSVSDVRPLNQPTERELAGRIEVMLNLGAYIATGGSRACTMCGAGGTDCLNGLHHRGGVPCCSACGNGNTHPAPLEHQTCAEWGGGGK